MTPLIDVIFLLLTFFIYSMLVMTRAEVLPVTLSRLQGGERASSSEVQWVTIDKQGALHFNREAVTESQLDEKLRAMAKQENPPPLYVVVESQTQLNLFPPFLKVFEKARQAGLKQLQIVGQPGERTGAAAGSGTP